MKEAGPDIVENFHWLHAPGAGMGWGGWLLIFILGLGIGGAVWWVLRRRKAGGLGFGPKPHQVALRALEALRAGMSEEEQRKFVTEVSGVVRTYIQERFGLRAPHRSTEEFLREMYAGEPALAEHRDLLGGFLSQCDLVKFAQRRVVLTEMNGLLDCARKFVEATIPTEHPLPPSRP